MGNLIKSRKSQPCKSTCLPTWEKGRMKERNKDGQEDRKLEDRREYEDE
jgi:hypothetical protein